MVPGSSKIRNELADAYMLAGQPEAALQVLEESLALAGEYGKAPRFYYLLGLAYREVGDLDKSIQALERYRLLSPSDASKRGVHGILGELYAGFNQWDSAADTFLRQGVAYQELGNLEESINHLEQSFEAYEILGNREGLAESTFLLGLAYLTFGDLDESAKALERNLELLPDGPRAKDSHEVLEKVYDVLGQLGLAATHEEAAQR